MTDKNHIQEHSCAFSLPVGAGVDISCPALGWIWLINTFMARISGLNAKELETKFSTTLQETLRTFFPRVQVFWSPVKEKPTEEELHHWTTQQKNSASTLDFYGVFNNILFELNQSCHSHQFFRQIAFSLESEGFSPSYVFFIKPEDHRIRLTLVKRDGLDNGISDSQGDREIVFALQGAPNPIDIIGVLQQKYEDDPTEEGAEKIKDEIIAYLQAWEDGVEVISPSAGAGVPLDSLVQPVRHFCLMALYMAGNGLPSCSYFIAPNFFPRHDSSMVIYWSGERPDRNLHYLLQMALQLNAFPLLMAEKTREGLMAQKHNIFNLSPLTDLAIASHEYPDLNRNKRFQRAFQNTRILNICLNLALCDTVETTELANIKSYKELFEFFVETTPHPVLEISKFIKPKLIFSPKFVDLLLSSGEKEAAFNALWNLWSNCSKEYSKNAESLTDTFWVVLRSEEEFLEFSFINLGEMPVSAQQFLLGTGPTINPRPHDAKKGLEIVKENLFSLNGSVIDVRVRHGRTNVKIRIPVK